jgi:hypothetical protein
MLEMNAARLVGCMEDRAACFAAAHWSRHQPAVRATVKAYPIHRTPTSVIHNHPENGKMIVNMHALVVRNNGKKPATNVRLGHNVLPDFSIYPNIQYRVEDLAGGGQEIVFPVLIAGAQVMVQYLYFPPLLANTINTHVQSDEGTAKSWNVWLVQHYPKWVYDILRAVLLIGILAIIYLLRQLAARVGVYAH